MFFPLKTSKEGIDPYAGGGSYYVYVCDYETDVQELPKLGGSNGVRPGSIAFCIENKTFYILSPARSWTVLKEV